jgi:iron complex transport system ATP-binding protein
MPIETDQLTVRRLGRTVLDSISLTIDDGQCVSVIGPNGAGKSTLMAALLGLLPTHGGHVRIDGTAINRLSRRTIARKIAYVPQLHEGYLGFTVRDVVEAGRYTHLEPLESLGNDDRQAIDAAVETCRIADLLDRTVDTLSGGERQKAWLAAALAQQTPTLFLDEPTNALDPAHQAELIRIMRAYTDEGNTLLVICHDLNLAMALGGRVVAIRNGSLFFDAPADVMLDTDRLAELFGTEFIIHRNPADQSPSIQLCLASGGHP